MLSPRLFGCSVIALVLTGCPFTDSYYVDQGAAQPNSTDAIGGTGATFPGNGGTGGTGGSDGVGGDSPQGDAGTGAVDGTGGSTSEAGTGSGSGADTAVGGDTAQGGTGGDTPVAGAGGTVPMDGGGTTGGGRGGRGGRWSGTGGAMGGGPAAGSGGTAPSAGDGTGASAGTSSSLYEPACDDAIVKGSSCTEAGQYCYRQCGPDAVGFKRETCMNRTYSEGECQFPASADYSCYSVPAPYQLPAACPGTVPRAADPCTVPQCTPCFGGTTNNPLYRDSSGTQKTGYCVCAESGVWTCATSSEPSSWPCPGNPGCD